MTWNLNIKFLIIKENLDRYDSKSFSIVPKSTQSGFKIFKQHLYSTEDINIANDPSGSVPPSRLVGLQVDPEVIG